MAGAVIIVLATALIVVCSTPRFDEPDVHDRQLDVVLALPLLGAALWLCYAWAVSFSLDHPLGDRGLFALTFFLTGATILLLGTRMAARLRFFLCAPLLDLGVIARNPVLQGALALGLGVYTVTAVVARVRPQPGHATAPVLHRAPLPRARIGTVVVGVVALGLGLAAV